MKVAFLSGDIAALEPGKAVLGGVVYARQAIPGYGLEHYGTDWECVYSYHCEIAEGQGGHVRVFDRMMQPHDDCDVLVFHRWLDESGVRFARAAHGSGQILINDLDDALMVVPKRVAGSEFLDPKNNPYNNVAHLAAFMKASDGITVSTDALAAEVRSLGVPTYVVRNSIDITAWPQLDPGVIMSVGWVGAVSWRGNDLPILKTVGLNAFLRDHGISFYHGGHQRNPKLGQRTAWDEAGINPDEVQIAWEPITQLNGYVKLWRHLAVSLVPIEQSRFGACKSWLKGLESSAAGLPWIASDHPEYRLLHEQGAGRLARNNRPSDWINHLTELLDPDIRRAEGAANRKIAEANDISRRWSDWDVAYRDIISHSQRATA